MHDIEIRRIDEDQAAAVTELWDRMCREALDGGPLTARGRRNITRMLQIASWHHLTCCLVATTGAEVIGFVVAGIDAGDGLLPGLAGEIHELYVVPEAKRRAELLSELARQAVDRLRKCGAGTIRKLADAEDQAMIRFWQAEGFEADMTCLSLYRP